MSVSTEFLKALDERGHEGAQEIVDRRRSARMAQIDRLAPDVRQCVHDYGWNVVNAFLLLGITKARHMRHLVETVLNEFSPTRGSSSNQGIRRAPGIAANHPLNREQTEPADPGK
jgi:hypothetical protein